MKSGSLRQHAHRVLFVAVVFAAVIGLLLVGIGPVAAGHVAIDMTGQPPMATDEAFDDSASVWIDPGLSNTSGTVDVIVLFDPPTDQPKPETADPVETLKTEAKTAQEPFARAAARVDGITVMESFWLANAALVEVETESVPFASIGQFPGVKAIHKNPSVQAADVKVSTTSDPTGSAFTYGLEQIEVPKAWDTFDTFGEGVSVAVLDTGVDATHDDITLSKWKDFDSDPSDEPKDYDTDGGHGTHVSGTLTGGDASGTHIGVAPEAQLYHGAVLTDCDSVRCSGSLSQILSGMEWAIDNQADIISMSLGHEDHQPGYIEAVKNANDAGTLVIAAIGNDGSGTSKSPGHIYDVLSVGATDSNENVWARSSGKEITSADMWSNETPDHWPEKYIVPSVTGPGVGVESALPSNQYGRMTGTSMATPHVAGVAALLQSASDGQLSPKEVREAIEETAWKPNGEPDEQDTRYGHGIVNAHDALDYLVATPTLTGTVTDAVTDAPIEGAIITVTDDDGDSFELETDHTGQYLTNKVVPGSVYELSVEADGYETDRIDAVEIPAEEDMTKDITLEGDAELNLHITDDHFGEPIESASVTLTGKQGHYPAETEEPGIHSITAVPSLGEYSLEVDAEGFTYTNTTIQIDQSGVLEESLVLTGNGKFEISTRDAVTDANLTDVIVTIERSDGARFTASSPSDEDGQLAVPVPGTGESYTLVGEAEGYENASEEMNVGQNETVTLELALHGAGTIEGTVFDDHFSEPLSEASISLAGPLGEYPVTENEDGQFRVDQVPTTGEYLLTTTHAGYETDERTVQFDSKQSIDVDVRLQGDATVELEVTDGTTEAALDNAVVTVTRDDGATFEHPDRTANDGIITIPLAGTNTEYELTIARDGFVTGTESVHLESGDEASLPVTLAGDAIFEITVTDSLFGSVITDATVTAEGEFGTYEAVESTNGMYEIPDIPSVGQYSVSGEVSGYETDTATLEATAGERTNETLALRGDADITLSVISDADREAIAGADVTIERADGDAVTVEEVTDDAGTAALVVPGTDERYHLHVDAPNFESNSTQTERIASGSSQTITISLVSADDWIPGFGAVAALIAISLAMGWYRRECR